MYISASGNCRICVISAESFRALRKLGVSDIAQVVSLVSSYRTCNSSEIISASYRRSSVYRGIPLSAIFLGYLNNSAWGWYWRKKNDLRLFASNLELPIGRERAYIKLCCVYRVLSLLRYAWRHVTWDPRYKNTRARVSIFSGSLVLRELVFLSVFFSQSTLPWKINQLSQNRFRYKTFISRAKNSPREPRIKFYILIHSNDKWTSGKNISIENAQR